MAFKVTNKKIGRNSRDINYLGKDFQSFRENLIEYAKTYFPSSYNDFNEASPGMMFIEMASYIGDVLSFYIDNQFKENLLAFAEQQEVLRARRPRRLHQEPPNQVRALQGRRRRRAAD